MGISKTDLFTDEQNQIARIAKALSHPARVAIVMQMLKTKTCINTELVRELGLAQATISQHLCELKDLGIIQGTVEGTRMCYCIAPEKWMEVGKIFISLFETPLYCDPDCC